MLTYNGMKCRLFYGGSWALGQVSPTAEEIKIGKREKTIQKGREGGGGANVDAGYKISHVYMARARFQRRGGWGGGRAQA